MRAPAEIQEEHGRLKAAPERRVQAQLDHIANGPIRSSVEETIMTTQVHNETKGRAMDFLLEEYRGHESAIFESERTGETRVNFFLTVTAAIFAALLFNEIGLMDPRGVGPRLAPVAVLAALLIFGWLTLARVVHRNLRTDREIESAQRIRGYFVSLEPSIGQYVSRPLDGRKAREPLSLGKLFTRGGLAETVMLWNAFITTILFSLLGMTGARWLQGRGIGSSLELLSAATAAGLGVIGFLAAWRAQQTWVNGRYKADERNRIEGRRVAGQAGARR